MYGFLGWPMTDTKARFLLIDGCYIIATSTTALEAWDRSPLLATLHLRAAQAITAGTVLGPLEAASQQARLRRLRQYQRRVERVLLAWRVRYCLANRSASFRSCSSVISGLGFRSARLITCDGVPSRAMPRSSHRPYPPVKGLWPLFLGCWTFSTQGPRVRSPTFMNRGSMAPPRRPRNADSGSSSGKTTKKAASKGRGAAPSPKMANPVTGKSTVVMRGGPNAGEFRTLTARTDMNLDAAARALRAAGGKVTMPPPSVSKTSGTYAGNAAIGPVRKGKSPSPFRVSSGGGKAARDAARQGASRYSRTTKAAAEVSNAARNKQATNRSTSRNVSGARGNAASGATARQRMAGMPGLKGR